MPRTTIDTPAELRRLKLENAELRAKLGTTRQELAKTRRSVRLLAEAESAEMIETLQSRVISLTCALREARALLARANGDPGGASCRRSQFGSPRGVSAIDVAAVLDCSYDKARDYIAWAERTPAVDEDDRACRERIEIERAISECCPFDDDWD